jgi:hypothetical protein
MKKIKIISQVVVDLTDGSKNTNEMVFGLSSDYTLYTVFTSTVGDK